MNTTKGTVLIVVCSVLVGILIITQVRMPHGDKLYVSAKALTEMQLQVESEKENIRKTDLLLEDAKKKLTEYETLAATDETGKLFENAKSELDYYRLVSGQTAVHGPGVRIVITDSDRELYEGENINNLLVHDGDVLWILNDLITAGAEAISINGHRLIDMSAVTCAGYTIRINGIREAVPFRIEAIGDPGRLYSAMVAPGSSGDILKQVVDFRVKSVDDITIKAYPGLPTHNYLKVKKEGDSN